MSVTRTDADVELADYVAVLRRRWRAVALGLVVGIVAALAAIVVLPEQYTSSEAVMVLPVGEDGSVQNGRTTSSLNLDTEAQIVKSSVVAQLALKKIGGQGSVNDVTRNVMVTVPPNTSVLNISFTAGTPLAAQRGASAFSSAYLENRAEVAQRRVQATQDAIQKQLETAQATLADLTTQLDSLADGSSERLLVTSRRDLAIQQIARLNSSLLDLDTGAVLPGDIITDASLPTSPSSPDRLVIAVSGVLAGLLAGLALAFVRDRVDQGVRTRRDLERFGLETLVARVEVAPGTGRADERPGSEVSESLRQLRNGLLARLRGERGAVLVAGVSDDQTGSTVAVSLAEALARSGVDVMFVSANAWSCAVAGSMAPAGHAGLAELLRDEATLDEAIIRVPDVPNLRVVSAGASTSLSRELVQSTRARAVFEKLGARSQVLVIDVAPTAVNSDAQSLAAIGQGVLLVATEGRSVRAEVGEAVEQMRHVAALVLGAVVASVEELPVSSIARPVGLRDDSDTVEAVPDDESTGPVSDEVAGPADDADRADTGDAADDDVDVSDTTDDPEEPAEAPVRRPTPGPQAASAVFRGRPKGRRPARR